MRFLIGTLFSVLLAAPALAQDEDLWVPLQTEEGKYFSRDIAYVEWPRVLSFRYRTDGDGPGGIDGRLVQDIRLDCRTGFVEVLKQTLTKPDGTADPEWGAAKPYSYHAPWFAKYGFGELCRGDLIAKVKEWQEK